MGDLTTLAALKQYMGGNLPPSEDAALSALITAYSAWVSSYCNRDFTLQTYDVRVSGRGNGAIMLSQYPVVSVATLELDGRAVTAQSTFGGYGFRFDDRSIIVDGLCFGRGRSNVHVIYTAGYAVIPADLAQAVNEVVALRYRLRDKLEWTSKSIGSETIALSQKDMPASVKTVLDQYKAIV